MLPIKMATISIDNAREDIFMYLRGTSQYMKPSISGLKCKFKKVVLIKKIVLKVYLGTTWATVHGWR